MYLHPTPRRAAPDDSPPERLDGARILLVEDDEDLLEAVAAYLREVGALVVCASTVATGRSALATGELDLLISDVSLPDGSGHELAAQARARGISALAVTGENGEAQAWRPAGFQLYLKKPCASETLLHAAAQLLLLRAH